jgi:hypothetical protein
MNWPAAVAKKEKRPNNFYLPSNLGRSAAAFHKNKPLREEGFDSTTLEGSVLGYIFAFFGLLLFAGLPGLLPLLLAGLTLPLLAALAWLTLMLLLLSLLALVAFALYALWLIRFLFLIHKSLSNPGDQVLRCLGMSPGWVVFQPLLSFWNRRLTQSRTRARKSESKRRRVLPSHGPSD